MSKSKAASTEADLEALQALQADAQELEHIQNLLGRFNAFDAIVPNTLVVGEDQITNPVSQRGSTDKGC